MTPCVRCLIYTRISKDKLGDGHGVANQLADLEKRAAARGWTITHRLSDNDIGVTRKDPTKAGKYRPGYEEVLRLVDAGAVDVVYCWKWDRFIREPLDLEFLIPRFDEAGCGSPKLKGTLTWAPIRGGWPREFWLRWLRPSRNGSPSGRSWRMRRPP